MAKENKIIFTDYMGNVPLEYYPYPAKKGLPEWYKEQSSYINGKKEVYTDGKSFTSSTIKKCMPVFDAITAGYIIPLPTDINISHQDGRPYYSWPNFTYISHHSPAQASSHPRNNGMPIPKFISSWVIQTPPGYSCLFIPPLHRDDAVFRVFEGVVDTDTYHGATEFPFTLTDVSWEGVIPAGTPMVQVIPFKRETWSMEISEKEKDMRLQATFLNSLRSNYFEAYKNKYWNKKDFN